MSLGAIWLSGRSGRARRSRGVIRRLVIAEAVRDMEEERLETEREAERYRLYYAFEYESDWLLPVTSQRDLCNESDLDSHDDDDDDGDPYFGADWYNWE